MTAKRVRRKERSTGRRRWSVLWCLAALVLVSCANPMPAPLGADLIPPQAKPFAVVRVNLSSILRIIAVDEIDLDAPGKPFVPVAPGPHTLRVACSYVTWRQGTGGTWHGTKREREYEESFTAEEGREYVVGFRNLSDWGSFGLVGSTAIIGYGALEGGVVEPPGHR